jgi:hypothetical protein
MSVVLPMPASVASRRTPVVALLLAGLASACGTTARLPEDHMDAAPVLTTEEEFRLGSVDDPELGFSRISRVEIGPDGRLYVGEVQDRQIRVYSPDGRLLHRIGRSGGGPGEFQGMPVFGVHGDTLWTYDLAAGRITLFDTRGGVLATAPTFGEAIPLADGRRVWVTPARMRADGRFISDVNRITYSRDHDGSGLDPTATFRVPRLLFDASGGVVDTAGWEPNPPPRLVPPPGHESSFRTVDIGGRSFEVPAHGSTLPVWVALEDGRVILEQPPATSADAGEVHVTRLDLAWDTAWHRVVRYQPAPYLAEELDSAAARTARGANVIGGRPPPPPGEIGPIARQIRAAMEWPPFRQPFMFAWVGRDGSVWLTRAVPPGEPAGWFVLEADGTPRGHVELPPRARVLWAEGDVVWASVPDDFDVPWLVRYRLRG